MSVCVNGRLEERRGKIRDKDRKRGRVENREREKLIVFYRKIGRNGRGGWRETKDWVCEKNGRKVEENKDRDKRRTQRKLYVV